MKNLALKGAFLVFALGGLVALPLAFASGDKSEVRRDCPGKVVCPLTGEEVCKDRCPLATGKAKAETRQDCPGKVTCPLTGEEVCKDECPVGAAAPTTATTGTAETADELAPCCRNLKK